MIIGTCYFKDFNAALRYYEPYGYDREDVISKWSAREIHVNVKPPLKQGETCHIKEDEGRYFIRSAS